MLDLFQILSDRHEIFGMPMLGRRHDEAVYAVVPSTVSIQWSLRLIMILNNARASNSFITFNMTARWQNAQHQEQNNWYKSGSCQIRLGRVSDTIQSNGSLSTPTHFITRTRLREALDRTLIAPIPLYSPETRKAKHIEMAQSLRVTQKARVQATRSPEEPRYAHDGLSNTGQANTVNRRRGGMC